MKKTVWLIALLFLPGWVSATELRVGMTPNYPPLVFKKDGQLHGIEVDNARAVSKMLSLQLRLVELPFAELIPALQAGKIDVIMSGLSVTPERSDQVLFTDPYLQVGQMAIVHRDKIARFASPWAIYQQGVRVGVEAGSTGEEFARSELPDAEIKTFESPDDAFVALRKGIIDIFIHDAPTSWQLANSPENDDMISLYKPLTEENLAWAVRKDDAPMADELNHALGQLRASGTLNYILNRWIPVSIQVD